MTVEELKLRIDKIASLAEEVKSRTDGLYNGWFDKYGRPNSYNRPSDSYFRPIDRDGRPIDRYGRPIGWDGEPIGNNNSRRNWRPKR